MMRKLFSTFNISYTNHEIAKYWSEAYYRIKPEYCVNRDESAQMPPHNSNFTLSRDTQSKFLECLCMPFCCFVAFDIS